MNSITIVLDNRFIHLPSDEFVSNVTAFLSPHVNTFLETGVAVNIDITYEMYVAFNKHKDTIFANFPTTVDWATGINWAHFPIVGSIEIGYETPTGTDLDDDEDDGENHSPRSVACDFSHL
jgi:hypothetical protein|tara:strand:- start:1765 stop:2127 length:363 start_codon:yes stop_codon:yes gene_type:complete